MNIYHLMRTDYVDYDEYDSFVVSAKSEESAHEIVKGEYGWPEEKDKVEVTIVGTALKENEAIILGSFNAG